MKKSLFTLALRSYLPYLRYLLKALVSVMAMTEQQNIPTHERPEVKAAARAYALGLDVSVTTQPQEECYKDAAKQLGRPSTPGAASTGKAPNDEITSADGRVQQIKAAPSSESQPSSSSASPLRRAVPTHEDPAIKAAARAYALSGETTNDSRRKSKRKHTLSNKKQRSGPSKAAVGTKKRSSTLR